LKFSFNPLLTGKVVFVIFPCFDIEESSIHQVRRIGKKAGFAGEVVTVVGVRIPLLTLEY